MTLTLTRNTGIFRFIKHLVKKEGKNIASFNENINIELILCNAHFIIGGQTKDSAHLSTFNQDFAAYVSCRSLRY